MVRVAVAFIAVLFELCISTSPAPGAADTVFELSETSKPLVARQEKARGLLRAWEFVSPELTVPFNLNGDDGLAEVQNALDLLLGKQEGITTSPALSDVAKHYLVYSIARSKMVNSIDFSPAKLRHFFELNAPRYPCEPRASVSELLIPKTYTNAAGTTAILDEIQERLEKESFPRVAYQINDRLGKHGTGYIGDVTARTAGADRFAIYAKVADHGRKVGGSGNPVGGPFETADAWIFIQVHDFIGNESQCFEALREQVIQDYGREWLKKIERDTLTTAARELNPEISPYTTGTRLQDRAILVDGHSLTFQEVRDALPFIMGDERNPRFWQSIQRQALEVELIYHSSTGKAIRELPEYAALEGVLQLLAVKRKEIEAKVSDRPTSTVLKQWFEKNRPRYTAYGEVTYVVYQCQANEAGSSNEDFRARCAVSLESLTTGTAGQQSPGHGISQSADARWTTSTAATIAGIPIKREEITGASFQELSREQQVALQSLQPGEWSPVFTENGVQKIVQLMEIDRVTPEFEDVAERVAADYQLELQMELWRNVTE